MSLVKIGVLISGSGSNLQSIIDNINSGKIKGKIEVVISNKKSAYGLERARNNNIDAVYINSKLYNDTDNYNNAIIKELKKRNVELVVLAGYLKILSQEFVKEYKNKIINIHPSLIPSFCGMKYYGLKVHEAAVNYGVKVTGATVHFVNEEADAGPIIMQETVRVTDNDTPETLQKKVLEIEHKILPEVIKLYCDRKIKVKGRKVVIEVGKGKAFNIVKS